MHQADCGRFWIDNVDGAAVGHVNTQSNTALICDKAVAAGKFAAHRAAATIIDDCDFVSVNLLGGDQRPIGYSHFVTNLTMRGTEPL